MKVKPFVASVDDYFDNGMAEYPLSARLFYYLVLTVLLVFTKLAWPWKIECRELLGEGKPAEGETGKVIICNHTSMLEIIAIVVDGWTRHRRVRPLFKSEFAKNKIIDWFFARVGGIPLHRGAADLKAVKRAANALKRGEDILIFPEGTRVKSDDQPVKMHGGCALIASRAGADIVPMAIIGARDIKKKGKLPRFFLRVWMRVAEPVTEASVPAGYTRKQRVQWMEDESIARMIGMRDWLKREHCGRN